MATYLNLPNDLPCHKQGFQPDAGVEHQVHSIAQHWLTQFEIAATTNNADLFAGLFVKNGFWRDIIAFTNDYRSIRTSNISEAAKARFPVVKARNFVFAETEPALSQPFDDVSFIDLFFEFETELGPCSGIAHLSYEDKEWKAFTCFTLLEGIHGFPQKVGAHRPRGSHNDKLSYDEKRAMENEFRDKDPEVLIIGGGHNGLAAASQLNTLGVQTLVIDRQKRVGDNWRTRYKSLSLHDPVYANHLPFFPFPSNWPIFTPAGKLANFMEAYVDVLEINSWCEATLDPKQTRFDEKENKWNVTIVRQLRGQEVRRQMKVSHLVLATGLGGGKPKMPASFPGQEEFGGKVVHSSRHGSGADWKGKKALVVGACTSGHDISVDFAQNGANVTMLQRSPTFVMSVSKGMEMMVSGLYGENTPPTDLADRIAESNPKLVAKMYHQRIIPKLAQVDGELLSGLEKAGFKAWSGPEGSGFLMMALEKAGGYYFSTGGSEMICKGDIKVRQGEIASFGKGTNEITFKDGSKEAFDVVVFATGYTGFPDTIRETIGGDWAEKFNPVWGLDEEGEIRGVCRESGIPNFFFLVGNLSACRLSSKILALQIKAQQLGKFGDRYTYDAQKKSGHLPDKTKFEAIKGMNGHPEVVKDYE
ncbi:hypothetical protein FFLO_04903 [Filobasidium floriforme]|uniref:FAD/NAD(P)-binding domain-containing protein n=1 Tax=Filobasidium floriforme TaxID=5210 RepID=A0A8K0NRU3_9TREE|nr:uncharacterized protein HD553DRAFT_351470 [Filobasidium floriforme]KAG7530601.1 hypothetical protein FFLO_04903 [Filobasidium floriforme]KAH8081955.1 hypothetical protein HD553DRAFT_351470 [Filobasidium floriforme]